MTQSATRASPSRRRAVFYSVAAQQDNLGDIEIRNVALEWIRGTGCDVIVYSGSMPLTYLGAFDIDDRVRFISSPLRYQGVLMVFVVRRRASIVFAPGPQRLRSNLRSVGKSLVNLFNAISVRVSGGSVLSVGRALRGEDRIARRLDSLLISLFHLYVVRDTVSAEVIGRHVSNAPDLAFINNSAPRGTVGDRTNVVISLRGDRPIELDGLRDLVGRILAQGLQPVIVSQVRRDDRRHRTIAEALAVPALLWEGRSHSEQMLRVRSAYADSCAVVSNRLHALIFGIQHRAVPIAVLDAGSDKLTSTLRPWMTLSTTSPSFEGLDSNEWNRENLVIRSAVAAVEAESARAALSRVKSEFTSALGGPNFVRARSLDVRILKTSSSGTGETRARDAIVSQGVEA